MMDSFFGITWAATKNLFFLPVVLILIFFIAWRYRRKYRIFFMLAAPNHRKELIQNFSLQKEVAKMILLAAALVFLFVSLLRPQWGESGEVAFKEGRDVIIALDISRSMLVNDLKPSRLERAKEKIKELLDELHAERVGLLIFSGAALIQCPLTTDYDAFCMFLRDVSVETISSGTTSIGGALNKVLEGISVCGGDHTKIVLLFTDGEDFSKDLERVKKKIVDSGVKIFTIGVGTEEGAPIPIYDELGKKLGYQKDENSKIIVSRLNSSLIRNLAHETGGKFLRMKKDSSDIFAIKSWIERFEKEKFESRNLSRFEDRYYYYAVLSFLLLIVEWMI